MKVKSVPLLFIIGAVLIWTGCSNYIQQARVYESLGDYNSAVLAYQKMMEKSDGIEKAYAQANLGRIKLKLGQNWEAEELLRKAKKQLDQNDPIYPEVCFNLGYCYYLRGEQWYNQAIAEMDEAVRVKGDLPKAHYYLAAMYFRTKQYQKALSHLPRIKGENEDKAVYITGLCYWRLGEYEEAERYLRKAVELAPSRTDKKLYMASLQELLTEIAQLEKTKFKIVQVKLNPIFLAFPTYYAENPIGKVTIKNRLDEAMKEARLLVEVKGFSSSPTPNPIGDLKPGQQITVPIKVVIDVEKAKTQMENIPTQEIIINLEYTYKGSKGGERRIEYTKLYNVHVMNWEPPEQIAAFVTHENPTVAKIADYASADYPLDKAAQIYNTLNLYGISYSRDPQNPFSHKLDYVLYPWETLERRGGDCDDLSVLYAACLQGVGIETAFLLAKDHIFVALNTEIPEDRAKVVIPKEDQDGNRLYRIRGGTAWVPVEVTALGKKDKTFFDAWRQGAKEWREYGEDLQFIPVSQAWRRFKPVWVGKDLDLKLPDRNLVAQLWNEDVRKVKECWRIALDSDIKAWQEMLKKGERSEAEVKNMIGINLALKGDFDEAKKALERATLLDPSNGKYHNNLANVLLLMGDLEGAKKEYETAMKTNASKAGIYYNMMFYYYSTGDFERAYKIKQMAESSDESKADFGRIAAARIGGAGASFGESTPEAQPPILAQKPKMDRDSMRRLLGFGGEEGTRAEGISNPEEMQWLLYWMK